ncbi:unnamed protein product [Durusdinium trenchii]|uniref:Uncharacterized protein n=1 Tax=Durusdinium trenchii TaxID=1381693 RepID=A0ABP0HJ21_9DINO
MSAAFVSWIWVVPVFGAWEELTCTGGCCLWSSTSWRSQSTFCEDLMSGFLYSPDFDSSTGHSLSFSYTGQLELECLNNSKWVSIWNSDHLDLSEHFALERFQKAVVELPSEASAVRFKSRPFAQINQIIAEPFNSFRQLAAEEGAGAPRYSYANWVQIHFNDGPPSRRWHTGVLDAAGKIWIFAGENSGQLLNDLWHFNTAVIEEGWAEIDSADAWPSPRFSHMAVMEGQRMWVFGGVVQGGLSKELWNYDVDLGTWTLWKADSISPTARESMTMISEAKSGRLWMFGGYDGSPRNDLWFFGTHDPTPAWTLVSPGPGSLPSARFSQVAVAEFGRMWIFGGLGLEGLLKDVWYVDIGDYINSSSGSATWTSVTSRLEGPTARESATAVTSSGEMWLFGGIGEDTETTDTDSGELWVLNLGEAEERTEGEEGEDRPSWREVDSVGPNGHQYHVAVLDTMGRMWCHNGELWYFDTNPLTSTSQSSSSTKTSVTSTVSTSTWTSTSTSTGTSSTSLTSSSSSSTSSSSTSSSSTSSASSSSTSSFTSTSSSSSSSRTQTTSSSSSTTTSSSNSSTTSSSSSTSSMTTSSTRTSTHSSTSSTSSTSQTSTSTLSSTTKTSSSTLSSTFTSTASSSSSSSSVSVTSTSKTMTSTSSTTLVKDLATALHDFLLSQVEETLDNLTTNQSLIEVSPHRSMALVTFGKRKPENEKTELEPVAGVVIKDSSMPLSVPRFSSLADLPVLVSMSISEGSVPGVDLPKVGSAVSTADGEVQVLAGPLVQISLVDAADVTSLDVVKMNLSAPLMFRASEEPVEGVTCRFWTKSGWSVEGMGSPSPEEVQEIFAGMDVTGSWCTTNHLSVFAIVRPCTFLESLQAGEKCFNIPTFVALLGGSVLCLCCSFCGFYATMKSRHVVGGKMELADLQGSSHKVPFHVRRPSKEMKEQQDISQPKTLVTWEVQPEALQATGFSKKHRFLQLRTKFFSERNDDASFFSDCPEKK